jgi:RHS repeat-associated protein
LIQYGDPETGLIYLRARYYDPTTAQFLSRDPAVAFTRSAYGYVGGNPLNGADPTGLGCGWSDPGACVSDVWHPVRFVATLPVTVTAQAVNSGYELVTGHDVDCHWNSANWVDVCTGGPTILGAPATTFGSVINTQLSYQDFLAANNCRLIAHETKHTDQWAIFGPGFAVLDTLASGYAELRGGQQHNPFEIWAGLKDGGYK